MVFTSPVLPWRWLLGSVVMLLFSWDFATAKEKQENTEFATDFDDVPWGRLVMDAERGVVAATIDSRANRELALPTPFPNITAAFRGTSDWRGDALEFSFNRDASQLKLHRNGHPSRRGVEHAVLHVSRRSRQFSDGRIVLSAMDGKVIGKTVKLESNPSNYRIGFWTDADDQVSWDYNASRWGKYTVHLTYSLAGTKGSQGSDVQIEVGDTTPPCKLIGTGSWYRLRVEPRMKTGAAVMDLRQVLLSPKAQRG